MSCASIGLFRALDPHVVELAHRLCADGGCLWPKPRRKCCRSFAQGIGPQALQPTLRIIDLPPRFSRTLPALLMFAGRAECRRVLHGRRRYAGGAKARAPRHLKISELFTQKVAEGSRRLVCRPRRSIGGAVENGARGGREALGRIDERRETNSAVTA